MEKDIIQHCGHCKNLHPEGFCILRSREIENPNWTTCKSWNTSEDRGGFQFSIVFDDYKYCALPYWEGNRPEAEVTKFNYFRILVKVDGKERWFDNCEQYNKHFVVPELMDRPVVNPAKSRPPTKQEIEDLEREKRLKELSSKKRPRPAPYDLPLNYAPEPEPESPVGKEFRKMVEERLKKFR